MTLVACTMIAFMACNKNDDEDDLLSGMHTVDLSKLNSDYTAQDGEMLTGTLVNGYGVNIAENAKVTLGGVSISANGKAGLTCMGNATITMDGQNFVTGGDGYAGIQVGPKGTILTFETVDGYVDATGGARAAGIGCGGNGSCGDIILNNGTIYAFGGDYAAGIGAGYQGQCQSITLNKGVVTATGGLNGAGIGTGVDGRCGDITIMASMTSVTATKRGGKSVSSIGPGYNGRCGRIHIQDPSKVTQE